MEIKKYLKPYIECTKVETEYALLADSPGKGGAGTGGLTPGNPGTGGGAVTPAPPAPTPGGSAKPSFFFDGEQENSYED